MNYKPYPTRKTERSRKNRKHAKHLNFRHNKSLHSSRAKQEAK